MNDFSHLDKSGNVRMVDVTDKIDNSRIARAKGKIFMKSETISALSDNAIPKGNVLTTAKIAGIQAAKKTFEMIPMCHQLNLSFVDIEFTINSDCIQINSIAKTKDATGVEMEALSAVSVAALTIYDMCKTLDKTMLIGEIKLIKKVGGKSDHVMDYHPKVGIVTLSDSVAKGDAKDRSGKILFDGFINSGCTVEHRKVLPDGSKKLVELINYWINDGVELIITTGGTGLGPRDLTIKTLDEIFESKIPGIEQSLHAYGRSKVKTAMLSRLTAGVIKGAIVICLPGSANAVQDALKVLIPTVFHAFHMMKGEKH